ncbi:hypothetical protein [Thiocapsa sp.]|uniref:hypothetical protein n=1 Tax=Thiocapsa sp. TaxID=2024551 RepID=UPI00359377D8
MRLLPERILSLSGEDGRLAASGGAAAREDLALYLIARFCGEAEAVCPANLSLFGVGIPQG